MSIQESARRLVRRTRPRRQPRPLNRAAIVSMIEFFDGEEGRVVQIQRSDGTTEVLVEPDDDPR